MGGHNSGRRPGPTTDPRRIAARLDEDLVRALSANRRKGETMTAQLVRLLWAGLGAADAAGEDVKLMARVRALVAGPPEP